MSSPERSESPTHKVIFATKEDHATPLSPQVQDLVTIDMDDDQPGLLLPDGEINWACPCMGGMVAGPCGYQFREAFSCFHYSKSEPKGADCYDKLNAMSECMAKYPTLYGKEADDEESLDAIMAEEQQAQEQKIKQSSSQSPAKTSKES